MVAHTFLLCMHYAGQVAIFVCLEILLSRKSNYANSILRFLYKLGNGHEVNFHERRESTMQLMPIITNICALYNLGRREQTFYQRQEAQSHTHYATLKIISDHHES